MKKYIEGKIISDTHECPHRGSMNNTCEHEKRLEEKMDKRFSSVIPLCHEDYCPLSDKSELEVLKEWLISISKDDDCCYASDVIGKIKELEGK